MSNNYCRECGSKLDEKSKFCPNCGKEVEKVQSDNLINSQSINNSYNIENTLHCPHCQSSNVTAQVVTESKSTGCLMIFVYIFLALTVIGIPIMIIILLAKGKKTNSKTVYVCQNCGKQFNKNSSTSINKKYSNKTIIFTSIFLILALMLVVIIESNFTNTEYVDISNYSELNPQVLYNDYIDNEISAKDKYTGNYYYFTGTIYDITQFLNDKYLTIRYTSERNNSIIIEITAYFSSTDDIKNVKKGDTITVCGKFKERTFDNYNNYLTAFSFHSCKLKEDV